MKFKVKRRMGRPWVQWQSGAESHQKRKAISVRKMKKKRLQKRENNGGIFNRPISSGKKAYENRFYERS
jgi:hypothetical protein